MYCITIVFIGLIYICLIFQFVWMKHDSVQICKSIKKSPLSGLGYLPCLLKEEHINSSAETFFLKMPGK